MFHSRFQRRVSTTVTGKSLTQQSSKDECDIHHIVKRAAKGLPVSIRDVQFGNGIIPDYHSAQNYLSRVDQEFSALPSHVRDRFRNNPGLLLDFISNPDNRQAMADLGFDTSHLPIPAEDGGVKQAEPAPADAGGNASPQLPAGAAKV